MIYKFITWHPFSLRNKMNVWNADRWSLKSLLIYLFFDIMYETNKTLIQIIIKTTIYCEEYIYIPIDIFYLLHKPNQCLLKWIGSKPDNQDLKVIGSPRFSVTNVAWFLYILLWVSVPFPATKKFNKLIWSSHVCNIYQPLIEPPTCFFKLSPLMPAMMINYFVLNPKVRIELNNL